jgi:hypothetical protein
MNNISQKMGPGYFSVTWDQVLGPGPIFPHFLDIPVQPLFLQEGEQSLLVEEHQKWGLAPFLSIFICSRCLHHG